MKSNQENLNEINVGLGEKEIPNHGKLIIDLIDADDSIKFDQNCFYLDATKISFPLILRNWISGDRFKPYGLKGKSKKLKEYFTDKKYNRFEKENALLLLNKDEICVVLGADISYNYRVEPSTTKLLKIQFIPII